MKYIYNSNIYITLKYKFVSVAITMNTFKKFNKTLPITIFKYNQIKKNKLFF